MESNDTSYISKIQAYKKKWDKSVNIKAILTFICLITIFALSFYNNLIFLVLGKPLLIIIYAIGIITWTIFLVLNFKLKIADQDIVYLVVGESKKSNEYSELFDPEKQEEKHKYSKNGKIIRIMQTSLEYYMVIMLAILTVTIIFSFILFPAQVEQTSMEETLYEGNKVIVLTGHKAKQGDIVVFEYDTNIQNSTYCYDEELLIKRVIAKEGDTLSCVNGVFYVNGKALDEPYVKEYNFKIVSYNLLKVVSKNSNADEILDLMANEYTIPEGYYFLMGDNRDDSNDSEEFGLVYYKQLVGVVKYYKNEFGWQKINWQYENN